MSEITDVRDAPWDTYGWHGTAHSIDGADTSMPTLVDVAELLYYGDTGDTWDGDVAGLARLNDGRLVAWESWYDATGSGFCDDAYGGDAEVWFAPSESIHKLVLSALTDKGRELCGIPRDGLPA